MIPQYGKVKTIVGQADGTEKVTVESFKDSKLDWQTVSIEETVRLSGVDELLTPAIDLISKIKNGHTNEIMLCVKRTPKGLTVTKTHLVLKEKK